MKTSTFSSGDLRVQPLVDNLGLVIIKDEHGVIEVQQRLTSSPRRLMMLQARRCHGQMPHLHPTRGSISIVFEVVRWYPQG